MSPGGLRSHLLSAVQAQKFGATSVDDTRAFVYICRILHIYLVALPELTADSISIGRIQLQLVVSSWPPRTCRTMLILGFPGKLDVRANYLR